MRNAIQLKAIIKNLAKEKHISAQLVMQNFMLERLLERISVSKYQRNFILKGGFLIAAMVGLDTRATMDMDATVKGLPVNEQNVRKMFEEICKQRERSTEDFKKQSSFWNGVETIPSILRRKYGIDKIPVCGLIWSCFFFGCKIGALNIKKFCRYMQGQDKCALQTATA